MNKEKTGTRFAANLWCWILLFMLSTLALGVAPLWLVGNRLKGKSWIRSAREGIWLYGWVYLMGIRPFVKTAITGADLALKRAPAIMVINHQSWLDIYLLGTQNARNLCFLVRSWPFRRLFFFQPLMRLAGYIETEGVAADEILKKCRAELQAGAMIVCFPEGTRSRDGSLGRFHSGVFKLATELDISVIPLVIRHSGQIMPKGSLVFQPGTIHLEMGPVVEPEKFKDETITHGAMRRFVRHHFKSVLERNHAVSGFNDKN